MFDRIRKWVFRSQREVLVSPKEPVISIDDLIHQWGMCSWMKGSHKDGDVHPQDLDSLREFGTGGRVFECIGEDNGYLVISYGDRTYRVRPGLFCTVPQLRYRVGENVIANSPKEGWVDATIINIYWHYERSTHYYLIQKKDGRESTNWYWESDLKKT